MMIAIAIALLGVFLMQDNGVLTQNRIKKITSGMLFLLSFVVLSMEYGALRGVFIFIGLISLLGTLFTLLLHKLPSDR